nr:MAG TPA: hypothetical protein [Caudoviricetes sp.]
MIENHGKAACQFDLFCQGCFHIFHPWARIVA